MIDYLTNSPTISVIIPFYNNQDTIEDTLNSLEKQIFDDFEVLLIEDKNSTSVQAKIIEKRYKYNLRFFKNTLKAGASSNRNIGLQNALGKYIQFLDADDLISDEKLKNQVALLENQKKALSFCKWGIFHKSLNDLQITNSILYKNAAPIEYLETLNGTFSVLMPLHSYLIPKELITISGQWDEQISLGDDGEFMNRVIAQSEKLIFSNDSFAYYRRGNSNTLSYTNNKIAAESNLLCAISYENLMIRVFGNSKKTHESIIRKYNLLFLWSYKKYPDIADYSEKRIIKLGGKLNMVIGGGSFGKFAHHILGTKKYLNLRYYLKTLIS